MRYVVYGAGAIGGTIGARLFEAGAEVVLVARGAHLDALRQDGLRFVTPAREVTHRIPVVGGPDEIDFGSDDVVLLCVKSQDTAPALDDLAAVAPRDVAVVCAQNGVENERLATRRFANVYGMVVMLPAEHVEPGLVLAFSANSTGILDVGRYPSGSDATADAIAADLSRASFSSSALRDVMRWKHNKLLMNLGNALDAACGERAWGSDLYARARDEGVACLKGAGIDFASDEEEQERRADHLRMRPVGEQGHRHRGGSTWQSLARGTGAIEVDYLDQPHGAVQGRRVGAAGR